MKKLINALVIVCLLAISTNYSFAEEKRTIQVDGVGEVQVKPDIIKISFSLETIKKNMEDALEENNEKVADILDFLKDYGIAETDFSTSNMSINTRYYFNQNTKEYDKTKVESFEVRKSMSVTFRKLDNIEEFINELAEMGITSLSTFYYDVENRIPHREKAREMALIAAKDKAEKMVSVLGAKLGKVDAIDESSNRFYDRSRVSNYVEVTKTGESSYSFSYEAISIKVRIAVTFEIID
jgi:uncharacterized protein